MRRLLVLVMLVAWPVAPARADDLDKALSAIEAGDCASGVAAMESLAKSGNSLAEFYMGLTYRRGICQTQSDAKAFAWFLSGAQHGQRDAQDQLGFFYANGIGTDQDLRQAAIWSAASAAQGNNHARENLAAICHELGWAHLGGTLGYPQDLFLAYVWFSLAKLNGHPDSDTYIEVTRDGPDANRVRAEGDKVIQTCLISQYRDCG